MKKISQGHYQGKGNKGEVVTVSYNSQTKQWFAYANSNLITQQKKKKWCIEVLKDYEILK